MTPFQKAVRLARSRKQRTAPVKPPTVFCTTYTELAVPLPPIECSPNWRGHWARKQAAVRQYRAGVALACHWAQVGSYARVRLHFDWYLARGPIPDGCARPRDVDNAIACCKSLIDGLRDAEVIPGDGQRHVLIGETRLFATKAQHGGRAEIVVRIEPVEIA